MHYERSHKTGLHVIRTKTNASSFLTSKHGTVTYVYKLVKILLKQHRNNTLLVVTPYKYILHLQLCF